MSSGRNWAGSTGSQTAAIAMAAGNQPTGESEEFDGSSWSAGGKFVSGAQNNTTASAGTLTAAMVCGANVEPGGSAGSINYLQTYDGTSWITSAALGVPRNGASVSGTTTSHVLGGGYGPSTYSNAAEEFTVATSTTNYKTITTS